jgi:hypothetical protein
MQPLLILAVAEPLLILAEQSPLAAVPPAPGSHSRNGQARAGFRRVAFILSVPDLRVGLSTVGYTVVALRRAKVCTLPLSFIGRTEPCLAAASPAPGFLHLAFPGARPNFPGSTRIPSASLYASRLPRPRWRPLQFFFPRL